MNKSPTLILAGFALLGALVVWQFQRISEMEEANASLRRQAEESALVNPSSAVPPETGQTADQGQSSFLTGGQMPKPKDAEREARFRERREVDRQQRQDAKLLALTTKLDLTAEQQAAIRAALDQGSASRDTVREAGESRRRAGTRDTEEIRRADMAKFAAIDAAQEETIAAGLSADQLAAYAAYQAEQKQTTVENRANQQLGELLTRFSLTEDQKDAAFRFFAKQEQENGFEPDRIAAMGGDFVSLFEQRQKNELEALKQILTPAQYDLYRTWQEQRSATFRNIIPGGPPGRP